MAIAKPKLPTLPTAPTAYTPPAAPKTDPFAANIDMNALIAAAAAALKPQFDLARTAETDRLAQQHVDIENDQIKRGWDRSIYTANRQQKATTDSNKNQSTIDAQAASAASAQAQGNYDQEYARQYAAWGDAKDDAWAQYNATVDAGRQAYADEYKKWQDGITNLWNVYNAQYAQYESDQAAQRSAASRRQADATAAANAARAKAAKDKAAREKAEAEARRQAQVAAREEQTRLFRASKWQTD